MSISTNFYQNEQETTCLCEDCAAERGLETEPWLDEEEVARCNQCEALICFDNPALLSYIDHLGAEEDDDILEQFEEAYLGQYDSETNFVEEWLDSTGQHSEWGNIPWHYINMEAIARDWFIDWVYSINDEKGGIFVYERY